MVGVGACAVQSGGTSDPVHLVRRLEVSVELMRQVRVLYCTQLARDRPFTAAANGGATTEPTNRPTNHVDSELLGVVGFEHEVVRSCRVKWCAPVPPPFGRRGALARCTHEPPTPRRYRLMGVAPIPRFKTNLTAPAGVTSNHEQCGCRRLFLGHRHRRRECQKLGTLFFRSPPPREATLEKYRRKCRERPRDGVRYGQAHGTSFRRARRDAAPDPLKPGQRGWFLAATHPRVLGRSGPRLCV